MKFIKYLFNMSNNTKEEKTNKKIEIECPQYNQYEWAEQPYYMHLLHYHC